MVAEYQGGRLLGRRYCGFTLVELLVVIGIIAVLISILLPTLNKAREAANKVKCAANEKQIVAAMFMYAQANQGMLPPLYWDDGSPRQTPYPWKSWDMCLLETVMKLHNRTNGTASQSAGTAVFACPSDYIPRTGLTTTYGDGRNPTFVLNTLPIRSYAINHCEWGYGLKDSLSGVYDGSYVMPWSAGCRDASGATNTTNFWTRSVPAKLAKVPARVWLLGENWGTSSLFTMAATPVINIDASPYNKAYIGIVDNSTLNGSPARFHARNAFGLAYQNGNGWRSNPVMEQSGGNYGYADGHVEFVKYGDVIRIRCDTDPNTNGSYMEDHWKWKPNVK